MKQKKKEKTEKKYAVNGGHVAICRSALNDHRKRTHFARRGVDIFGHKKDRGQAEKYFKLGAKRLPVILRHALITSYCLC